MQEQKIGALRQWMVSKGCKIHPSITIPSSINGVQGIATNKPIPHKTLIIAIPSALILTATKCYNDPKLKKLFLANDDLFDYQASEDAEFNILCVFLMYHKINIEKSQWKEYLETISEPETAIDWKHEELKGLNKSMIEEIIHVQIQCDKLQNDLVLYLGKRKQFSNSSEEILRKTFNYCYRSVMTRCFGYYFNEASLIPIADLINHGCQCIDHQLLNLNFQNGKEFQQGYYNRKQKMNCQLLNIDKAQAYNLPFRQKFLVQNKIIQYNDELSELTREKINKLLYEWNEDRLKKGASIDQLHFCSQDEEEDNDTDEDFQVQQMKELQYYKRNEEEQMGQFMNNVVKIQRYKDVQSKLSQLDGPKVTQKKTQPSQKTQETPSIQSKKDQQQPKDIVIQKQKLLEQNLQTKQKKEVSITQQPVKIQGQVKRQNPFSNAQGKGVPISLMQSSSSQEDSDQDQWGLKEGSYFTMSTSSPVGGNRQIYNSYGSRTNKFLLIWYGFTYPNNLYDSVSFRLQVQFNNLRPADEIVLDSYVGGQGLSFKKANLQVVKESEISRQFRLKRSNICDKLLTFLRLYMMNFYEQSDLYKLFITFPASIHYELFVLKYYKTIVQSLYSRYPLEGIQQLKEDYESPEYASTKFKIRYKIIYLEEQRKLLDLNVQAISALIQVLNKVKENGGMLRREMYEHMDLRQLRMIRKYLVTYDSYIEYILYRQEDNIKLQQHKGQRNDEAQQQDSYQVSASQQESKSKQPQKQQRKEDIKGKESQAQQQ